MLHFKIGVPQIISNGVRHYRLTRLSDIEFKIEDLFPSVYFPQPEIRLELMEWDDYLLKVNKKYNKKGPTYLYKLKIFSTFETSYSICQNINNFEWFGVAEEQTEKEVNKLTVHLLEHLNLKRRLWIR